MIRRSWAWIVVFGALWVLVSVIEGAEAKPGKSKGKAPNDVQDAADPAFDSVYRALRGDENWFYVIGFKNGYGNANKSVAFRLLRGKTAAAHEIANFLRSGTQGRRWIVEPFSNEAAARAAFAAHVDYAQRSGYR